jgi:hypothetical protein
MQTLQHRPQKLGRHSFHGGAPIPLGQMEYQPIDIACLLRANQNQHQLNKSQYNYYIRVMRHQHRK